MNLKYLLLTFVILGFSKIYGQSDSQPETVKHVDLKKYVGLWYEIAKIPNRFQKNCRKNTTAEYKIMDDGRIEVTNTCIEDDGEKNIAKGVAKVVDKKTNAKLEVSFFSILGIRPFWGDYWIIGLGNNYNYAVIGHPDRKYGWILSRTPKMSEENLKEAFNILTKNGYNTSNFEMTEQD